ncbi:MAG: HAMP domain-containing histidine kinase [Clostridiaceae bacterium]|nr:HAMP domain-containing histidine kinase [Clostridiaceae bacterium]
MNKKQYYSVFQRSRHQIVAVVMTIFLLVFTVTLAAIYIISYQELYQKNLDMLEIYSNQYQKNGNPSQNRKNRNPNQNRHGEQPPQRDSSFNQDDMPEQNSTRYLLASFYSVALDAEGQPFSVDLGNGTLYTESQITEVAEQLLDINRTQGTYGNFIYSIRHEETYTLIALMDNTLISDSFTALFRNTLLLGAMMVAVLFLCTIALARWIIRPLEESDRRQRQFISDAGHELKTPVSVVEANAELLEREIGTNKWLNNIRSESNRMAELVSELLTLVRTECEATQMEPLDLSRLVLGGILPFESVAFEMERKLEYQIEENITIYGNPSQLSRLVSILMDNALSHSAGTGDITIHLHQEKAGIILTISNPGFIPEQDRSEIFVRFFRSDANRSDTGHYGLGLTIAKNIITEHQGEIQVSCLEGQVSFLVRFPRKEKSSSRKSRRKLTTLH